MKEATGELSTTVIAVVAIAAIAALFTTLIYPGIKATILKKTHCAAAYGCKSNGDGTQNCYYDDENGNKTEITCDAEQA